VTREEIENCIPHRPPFLWLDEVTELSDSRIVARKHIAADLDVFRGHYPSFPVLPGVLQCEAIFQAGAVLISKLMEVDSDAVPVVTRIQNAQFRKLVRPGDTLEVEVQLTERLSNAFFLRGKATVAGQTTARLEFACAAARIAEA
jgi:3-hydroxyacyl-[acyl-carrier-protein] dehydratase